MKTDVSYLFWHPIYVCIHYILSTIFFLFLPLKVVFFFFFPGLNTHRFELHVLYLNLIQHDFT